MRRTRGEEACSPRNFRACSRRAFWSGEKSKFTAGSYGNLEGDPSGGRDTSCPPSPFGLARSPALRETTGAEHRRPPRPRRRAMDAKAFEAGLTRDGYQRIETKELPRDYRAASHAHDFDVRALVLAGEITLTWNGGSRSVAAGEEFTMYAGCAHAEAVGPDGVRYLVGRRTH